MSRVERLLFLLLLGIYGFFYSGGGWNQNSHFDLTRALVERRTLAIDELAGNTGDVVARNGHIYSNKAPGVSFAAAVPYAFAFAVERAVGMKPDDPFVSSWNLWLCTLFVCALPGALLSVVLHRMAGELGASHRRALAIALSSGLATPLFAYSTTLFVHVPSALFVLLMFRDALLRETPRLLRAGVFAGLAVVFNYLAAIAVICVAIALLASRRRELWRFVAGGVPFALFVGWYQVVAFGAALRNPIAMNDDFVTRGAALGVLNAPSLEAFIGITVSPYRGLFYLSPVLLLALGGVRTWLRERRVATLAVIASILLFVGFNLCFNNWEGGFGIGPRYLTPITPLLALLGLRAPIRMRSVAALLLAWSLSANAAAVVVDPLPSGSIRFPLERYIVPLLVTGRFPSDPLLRYPWSPLTFTGHTSVNRHHVLEAVPFQLYRPGGREAEYASFNLGEWLLGSGTLWSLLPLLLWVVTLTTLLARQTRFRRE